jgi:hypothetical protein
MTATATPIRLGRSLAVLAACSGSSEPSLTDKDQDAARVRLTQCLRENGVDVPDITSGGGPPGSASPT